MVLRRRMLCIRRHYDINRRLWLGRRNLPLAVRLGESRLLCRELTRVRGLCRTSRDLGRVNLEEGGDVDVVEFGSLCSLSQVGPSLVEDRRVCCDPRIGKGCPLAGGDLGQGLDPSFAGFVLPNNTAEASSFGEDFRLHLSCRFGLGPEFPSSEIVEVFLGLGKSPSFVGREFLTFQLGRR